MVKNGRGESDGQCATSERKLGCRCRKTCQAPGKIASGTTGRGEVQKKCRREERIDVMKTTKCNLYPGVAVDLQ